MDELCIVIVNWNTKEFLRECLSSIYSHTGGLSFDIIVVDNNSSDGSTRMLHEQFPRVQVIENGENVGYARANNQVLNKFAAKFVLLLNPDTLIRGDALETLMNFLDRHPDAGAIGPKIIHPDMRLKVLSCGYQPTLRTLFNHYFFLSAAFPDASFFRGINLRMGVHDDVVREVEWLSGACILVRKEVVEQVGALSEDWFMYAEDMEWCQRMLEGGWKLYHVPQAVIEHRPGSSAKNNEMVSTMWVRSLRSYFVHRENPSWIRLALFDLVLFTGLFLRSVLYTLYAFKGEREQRPMWQGEAVKFKDYAVAALDARKAD